MKRPGGGVCMSEGLAPFDAELSQGDGLLAFGAMPEASVSPTGKGFLFLLPSASPAATSAAEVTPAAPAAMPVTALTPKGTTGPVTRPGLMGAGGCLFSGTGATDGADGAEPSLLCVDCADVAAVPVLVSFELAWLLCVLGVSPKFSSSCTSAGKAPPHRNSQVSEIASLNSPVPLDFTVFLMLPRRLYRRSISRGAALCKYAISSRFVYLSQSLGLMSGSVGSAGCALLPAQAPRGN
mmetsp:Transcript_43972/g.93565  ORF Transcript_43972/g.93565 Transcript_43972/m.93565 type:complete len:238 (-) Transcript_43972:577-1290(-)